MSVEGEAAQQGINFLSALNTQAAPNAAHMERIRDWAFGHDVMMENLLTQAETSEASLDTVAKEPQSVKRKRECFQTESQKAKEFEGPTPKW